MTVPALRETDRPTTAMTLAVEKAKEARQKDWQKLYKRELRRREKERRMQVMQQEYLFRQRDDRYGMGPCGEFHIPPIMFGSSGGSSNTTTATPAARGPSNTPGRPTKVAGGSSSKKFGEVGTPMQEPDEGAQAVLHITPQMDPSSVAAAHLQALIESENKRRQKVDEAQLEWDKRCLAAWDHEVDRRKQWDISHQLQQAERSRRVEAEERRRKEFNCYVQHRLEIEDIHLAAVPPDHPMGNTPAMPEDPALEKQGGNPPKVPLGSD
ncbi:hypothetical protein FOZ62_030026 [Perkinsus olseni]|uniref:Uncharacterized protein n=1 Tax=Perkinsus olseni TaxID=32597 RepID=A0A7J6R2M6_PEROL|nr:hypothetical protein FOZ62_030026 [Perkinsus olseni]